MAIYYPQAPASTAPSISTTSTINNVAASVNTFVVQAANANRMGGTIFNDTNRMIYVLCGTGNAGPTNQSFPVGVGLVADIPANYTGVISAQCTGAAPGLTGFVRVTEFTP